MTLAVNDWAQASEQVGRVTETPAVAVLEWFHGFRFRKYARTKLGLPTPESVTVEGARDGHIEHDSLL